MSTPSMKPLPTLKGIFNVPKVTHRRDFLRENKLSLRELEKVTNKRLAQEPPKPKWMRSLQQQQQQHQQQQQPQIPSNERRRSASHSRVRTELPEDAQSRSRSNLRITAGAGDTQSIHQHSQQELLYQAKPSQFKSTERCQSCGSQRSYLSKSSSCDKEIQTEDIVDEEFLYHALKKCNPSEKSVKTIKRPPVKESDTQSIYSRCSRNEHNNNNSNKNAEDFEYEQNINLNTSKSTDTLVAAPNDTDAERVSLRSHYSSKSNASKQQQNEDNLTGQFENLAINEDTQDDQPLSARSRQTIRSTSTVKSKKSFHKLGSRDDLRLPRYLEREKREKEEERQRELQYDEDCPAGHIALTEDQRLAELGVADKKFKELVNELNRLPMTTQTLRVLKRKAEIEKQLASVEMDLRKLSKPRVYIKYP